MPLNKRTLVSLVNSSLVGTDIFSVNDLYLILCVTQCTYDTYDMTEIDIQIFRKKYFQRDLADNELLVCASRIER